MIWRAQSAVRSRNQADPVVALLAVLGLKIVEVSATETLITGGLTASRPANVSPRLTPCRQILSPTNQCLFSCFHLCVWQSPHTYTHQQPRRRRPLVPYAPNAASSQNPGNLVAAVAVVLGPETADVLVTSSLITLGTRASRPAKHCRSPWQPSADSHTRLNSENPLRSLTCQTRKQSLNLKTRQLISLRQRSSSSHMLYQRKQSQLIKVCDIITMYPLRYSRHTCTHFRTFVWILITHTHHSRVSPSSCVGNYFYLYSFLDADHFDGGGQLFHS